MLAWRIAMVTPDRCSEAPAMFEGEEDGCQRILRDGNSIGRIRAGDANTSLPHCLCYKASNRACSIEDCREIGGICQQGCIHTWHAPARDHDLGLGKQFWLFTNGFRCLWWCVDLYQLLDIIAFRRAIDAFIGIRSQDIQALWALHSFDSSK